MICWSSFSRSASAERRSRQLLVPSRSLKNWAAWPEPSINRWLISERTAWPAIGLPRLNRPMIILVQEPIADPADPADECPELPTIPGIGDRSCFRRDEMAVQLNRAARIASDPYGIHPLGHMHTLGRGSKRVGNQ